MAYKPKRIASPSIIADAASALYAAIAQSTRITDAERDLWINATTKAFNQLMDGVRFEREEDGTFVFPNRSRSGLSHRVNGDCDCEAVTEKGYPCCWHRAAKKLVLIIEEIERQTLLTPPPVPPQCSRCGAAQFELNGRLVCPACQHSRPPALTPRPLRPPRTPADYERAEREMAELFPAKP